MPGRNAAPILPFVRVLAVDFGEKRIGLAVSDESGAIVVPVGAFPRKSDAQAAAVVSGAAKDREVARIVVGNPVGPGGEETTFSRRARNFARRVQEVSRLPVDLHDEGLTSVAAEENLLEAGLSAERRDEARDAEAAAVLLRDFLADLPPRGAAV